MGVLDSALNYIGRGFYVFPTYSKTPILKNWPNLATNDPNIATDWFTGDYSYADGFGVCPKDICVVIDVDIKDGKKGKESLQRLISEYNLPKNTFIVKTRSGGLHLYYNYPTEACKNSYIKSISNWKLKDGTELNGIDIRGNKGQVIGPTNDNNYSIISDKPLIDLPQSVIDQLPIDSEYGLKTVDPKDAEVLVYDKPSLGGMIPKVIKQGERHDTLISLTASWSRKLPYETAKILLKVAIDRCEGEIDYDDYLSRLDDAYAKFEPVITDKLQYLLDHLVFVSFGNRVFRKDKPANIATLKLDEAKATYKNWLIWDERTLANGDTKKSCREAFNDWMKHPDRQSVENIGYKPIYDDKYVCPVLGAEVMNTYRPPMYPRMDINSNDVKPFIDLVEHLWGEHAGIILDWCAHILQHPTEKVHWAPLLVTPLEGMGKNLFFSIFSSVIGTWNTSIINAALFNKSFNTFLVENLLILINEVQEVGKSERRAMMGKLKGYITESDQPIEGKGSNIYKTRIYANFIIFSNVEDALQIEDASRRFFIHINYGKPMPDQWYLGIVKWMESDGPLHLFNWLLNRDISEFKHTGYAPHTESKDVMVEANKSEIELIIKEHIETKQSIFGSDIVTQQGWEYYIKNVLHKGQRLSLAQEKYLKKQLFIGVRSTNKISKKSMTMQLMLPKISPLSDDTMIIQDQDTYKATCWTCRNHGKYDTRSAKDIRDEYHKIFARPHDSVKSIA